MIVALAALSLPLSGSMAHARSGWTGVVAVAVAATVCCLAAIIALFLTERTRGSLNAISGLLGTVAYAVRRGPGTPERRGSGAASARPVVLHFYWPVATALASSS